MEDSNAGSKKEKQSFNKNANEYQEIKSPNRLERGIDKEKLRRAGNKDSRKAPTE